MISIYHVIIHSFKLMSLSGEFYAGYMSGMVGTIIGHPFDVLKTSMQVDRLHLRGSYQLIFKQYGIRGFYKGILPPLFGRAPLKGVLYAGYNGFNNLITPTSKRGSYLYMALCGGLSGIVSSPFSSVMELNKITNQRNEKLFNYLRANGGYYLIKGIKETMYRECPYYIVYFPLYHYLKSQCETHHISIFWAGGFAGTIPWIITYPLDVIKTQNKHQITHPV